ncbi:MAG: alcohol dehydrogenase catalytic domain-containing protein [Phycisphaerales bacterium]|nr:alcohol dehydrogenase catalytic domain-containing protein [Phycisphaerales bacterium]
MVNVRAKAREQTSVRALRFQAGQMRLDEVPCPVPASGEVLIRPTRMGVASPDLAVVDGAVRFAGVLGHEFVGIVEQAADKAVNKELGGRRVVGLPTASCAACDLCKAGLPMHCQGRRVLGLWGRDGCFADRFTIPAQNLVEVPADLDDDHAVFAHALGAAIHAVRMIRIVGKPFVTILGDGPIGLLAAQVASRLNASVRLLGRHERKYTLCERWGIKHRHESEVGRRHDQDVVIDCTGTATGLSLALSLVRPRGKVILKTAPAPVPADAFSPQTTSVDLRQAVANEIEILGAAGCSLAEGVAMLARREVDVLPLITRRFRLADAPTAFEAARDGVKVLLEP